MIVEEVWREVLDVELTGVVVSMDLVGEWIGFTYS